MGYTQANGMWADTDEVSILASAARTASGSGSAIEVGDRGTLRLDLAVTAAAGTTPTLDVTVETSSNATTWRSLGTFSQKTAVSSERKSFPGCDRFARVTFSIAGTTPSFTCSVVGEAA